MSAIEDDEAAAFAHQAQLEFRQRADGCEKCGGVAFAMWDERLLCREHYDDLTIWEPREGYEEFLDPPQEVPEETDDGAPETD